MKKHLHLKTSFVVGIFLLMLSLNLKSQCSVTFTTGPIAPLTWTVNPTYGATTAGAVWYWGDGNQSVGLYPSHTYTTSGWYQICVSVWNSPTTCSVMVCDSSYVSKTSQTSSAPIQITVINATATAIQEMSVNESIGLFPNPSNGKVTLQAQKDNGTVTIYNVLGMKVKEINIDSNTAIELDLSSLEDGIYNVEFDSGIAIIREKVILNK